MILALVGQIAALRLAGRLQALTGGARGHMTSLALAVIFRSHPPACVSKRYAHVTGFVMAE